MEYQRTDKSAVTEHVKNCGREIQLDLVIILNKEVHFGNRMYKKAIEFEKFLENYNRQVGWNISKTRLPKIFQEKRTQKTIGDNIRIEETTIVKNENRRFKTKYNGCQKQRTDKNNANSKQAAITENNTAK